MPGCTKRPDVEWDDTIPVIIFDNDRDGKKWECQHYEQLGFTPIQTWLLHFWYSTKEHPCLFLQPVVFDGRTNDTDYTPDRDYMFKQFQKIWCGPQHTGQPWLLWANKKTLGKQSLKAYTQFRSKTRRVRKPFPQSRPFKSGRHIVTTQKVKERQIKKANQHQRAKDDVVRQFRGWEYAQGRNRAVQAAIRGGGMSRFDDQRKIMALCDADEGPEVFTRRHRSRHRVKGGQKFATRSRLPNARTLSQLFRDFQTEHKPRRMDLKNDDGTHFESGARFDTVIELATIIKGLIKRGKLQDKSESRVWTGQSPPHLIVDKKTNWTPWVAARQITLKLFLHDGGRGWGGGIDVVVPLHVTLHYVKRQLLHTHGPLPDRTFFFQTDNEPVKTPWTMESVVRMLGDPRLETSDAIDIKLQVVYNGYVSIPEFQFDEDQRLPSSFSWGDMVSTKAHFKTDDPPFQPRHYFPKRNGLPVAFMELSDWGDGTTANGRTMFSRKAKLVDRARHIFKDGHTPVFPVEIHLTSEEKIQNCSEYNDMRDRYIQEFIDVVKSKPYRLPTGEEFYIHLLFTSLEGDGKYLGGCIGLTKGNASHSRKCQNCMAVFGNFNRFNRGDMCINRGDMCSNRGDMCINRGDILVNRGDNCVNSGDTILRSVLFRKVLR
jgi:hypothetical protein